MLINNMIFHCSIKLFIHLPIFIHPNFHFRVSARQLHFLIWPDRRKQRRETSHKEIKRTGIIPHKN